MEFIGSPHALTNVSEVYQGSGLVPLVLRPGAGGGAVAERGSGGGVGLSGVAGSRPLTTPHHLKDWLVPHSAWCATHTRTHMHTRTHAHANTHTHTRTHMHARKHRHTHTRMHAQTHTHTRTQTYINVGA